MLSNETVRVSCQTVSAEDILKRAGINRLAAQERAILAGILAQTAMLDAVLSRRDQARASAVRSARLMRPVRNKSERVFGDARDLVFCYCVDLLGDIATVQEALGARAQAEWPPPHQAFQGWNDCEVYLIGCVNTLAERSQTVR